MSLALLTFLASAVATSNLQSAILSRGIQNVDKEVELARSLWCSLTTTSTSVGPLQTFKRAWDAPMVVRNCQTLVNNAMSDIDKAILLAVKADYCSEWIFALPISACGHRISNEAVRITSVLRLRLNICEPHSCPCSGVVDAKGIHGLSCKCSTGRSMHHQQIIDLVWRALRSADTLSVKEPSGLLSGEDKRPDGLKLVPWQCGHCLAWNDTVVDTLARIYVVVSAQVTGTAAQAAAERNVSKYAGLPVSHLFVQIAIETLGPINEAGHSFLSELGRRLSTISDDP